MPSESSLIDAFISQLPHPKTPRGPGDDCAVVPPSRVPWCITSDAVVEGVHFSFPFFSWADVGHKAIASNLSDLAAMGAKPAWWMASLGLPRLTTPAKLKELASGIAPLARASGLQLIGGNLTYSPLLTITLTLGGEAKRPLLRSGAKPRHLLYLGGKPGEAAAGLELADEARRQPVPTAVRKTLQTAQRRPMPQLALGRIAAQFASAAIDVSDGLLIDAHRLAAASKLKLELNSAAIPVSESLAMLGDQAMRFALTGGEDYGLLLAVPEAKATAFENACAKAGVEAAIIGLCARGTGVTLDGKRVPPAGYDHFG